MTDLWALLPASALLFLPGYALSYIVPKGDMEPFQRAIAAVGLSLALAPLLLLWATFGGLAWGGLAAWGLLGLAGAVSVWRWWGARGQRFTSPPDPLSVDGEGAKGVRSRLAAWARARPQYPLLLLILAVSLAVRLLAIRDLSIPSWGDSLSHAWLARLISEGGQVPASYYPYFPLDSLTYHFGFHALVAFFHWATGLPILKSILVTGQVLNALSLLTVYLLAHRLTRNHTAALLSALVVGLISAMPAYYVNWGRYAQLGGQVLLPAALFLIIEAVERRHLGYLALAAVSAAGLFLTHYRVAVFYALFLVAYLGWRAWRPPSPREVLNAHPRYQPWDETVAEDVPHSGAEYNTRPPARRWGIWRSCSRPSFTTILADWGWVAGVGVAALALASPWLWNLASSLPRAQASVPQLSQEAWEQWLSGYNSLGDVAFFLSWPLLLLSLAGLLWALHNREGVGIILGSWVALLFFAANADRLGLGGGAWLNNFAVLILLYLPASILVGWLGAQLWRLLGRAWKPAPYALAGLATAASLWGAWGMANMVDPQYVVVTPADQRAMDWVAQNTPQDARFLVNYTFAYGGRLVVGSDGGWWLPYLTGRESNVPLILYGSESSPGRDYAARVNALARSLEGSPYTKDGLVLMREAGITHIYIGKNGGFLDPNKLLAAGHQPIYRDGPVWVFRVNYSGASL